MSALTKPKAISRTVIPAGYTGKSFNLWIRHCNRELDKIRNTDVARKILIN